MARLLNLYRMSRAITSFEDHFSVEELDEKLTTLGDQCPHALVRRRALPPHPDGQHDSRRLPHGSLRQP